MSNDLRFGDARPVPVVQDVTAVQTETALVAAPGAGKRLIIISVTVAITTIEAAKVIEIREADGADWLTFPMDLIAVYHVPFRHGLRLAVQNKAINWLSTTTGTGIGRLTVVYATQGE